MNLLLRRGLVILALTLLQAPAFSQQDAARPGSRTLMDAHNCYPYFEWWSDRIDRALSDGTPVAIEQDLVWYSDPRSGASRSVVAHGSPLTGQEPTLDKYFFERVRGIVEQAIGNGDRRGPSLR